MTDPTHPHQPSTIPAAPSTPEEWPRFLDDDRTPALAVAEYEAVRHHMAGREARTGHRALFLPPANPPPAYLAIRSIAPGVTPLSLAPATTPARRGRPPTSRIAAVATTPNAKNLGWYCAAVFGVVLFVQQATLSIPASEAPAPASANQAAAPVKAAPLDPGPSAPMALALAEAAASTPVSLSERDARSASAAPAVALARNAVAVQPQEPATFELATRMGEQAQQAGELQHACAEYTRALAANPRYFPAALGLADARWQLGQTAAATFAYQRMLELFPASMLPARVVARANRPRASAS